ncbi:MAG TPA: sigma-70 family RNA polymerase sigma factor [Acidimicrobiales bacterium]|jgi:RNA polymerase sigma factor (sigma-70 family)|nr:sigma-70 family RNA polymerase sigma factor [Acidimicrobiales bacterium]
MEPTPATEVLGRPAPRRPRPSPVGDWTDEELLLLVRSGDAPAYGEIYRRYEPEIRRFATSLLGRRHLDDVPDVVADAFTRVLQAIENGNGPVDHPGRYLMATVRTTVIAAARQRNAQVATAQRVGRDRTATAQEPPWPGDRPEVLQALDRLPLRMRQVLWATVVEGRDHGELGEHLGLSRNAVAALAYRHRRALRRAYLEMHAQQPA